MDGAFSSDTRDEWHGRARATMGRAAPRFALLVRSAKLIADGREYVCVLRDASATGAKVRLFHPLPDARELALELVPGEVHAIEPVWQIDDQVGLRFAGEVDIRRLLDEQGSYPKRQLRLATHRAVELAAHSGWLHNISQSGAGVACESRLLVRQSLKLDIAGIASIAAKVCWRRQEQVGLVFERSFALEELATLVLRLNRPPTDRAD